MRDHLQTALLAMALWLCPLWTVLAAPLQQEFDLGGELLWFDYREFDTDGSLLDKETGPLPGLAARWQLAGARWFLAAEGEWVPGLVEYDGQTQNGIPVRTDTRTFLFDARLLGGRAFGDGNRFRLFGGLGYHDWYRDIQPGTAVDGSPVAGLLEVYQWAYLLAGGELRIWHSGRHEVHLEGRYRQMLFGTMAVDFKGYQGYDDADVVLATEDGLRLALRWRWELGPGQALVFEPHYATWNLGRSNLAAVIRNGASTGILILEPRSQTRKVGMQVSYRWRF